MGVPAYFKSITRKYPIIIDHSRPKCSRLFLDLNCAIHQCTQNILHMNQMILPEVLEKEIANHTVDYILKIVNYVEPLEYLMIAIDGIPPRAKIVQQRKRRFVSSWKQELINAKRKECNIPFTAWDTNAITPGTNFMNSLSKHLHDYFDDSDKFKFKVIVSDSNDPGEGEAKILDYIKANAPPNHSDIIYGLDADLIMLSLLSSKNNIYLLREPVHYDMKVPKPFLLLNIQLLRRFIAIECSDTQGNTTSEEEMLKNDLYDENIVWDYVVLCFFQGNDFIPPLSFLKIRYNGIDMMIQTYKKVKSEIQQNLVMKTNNKYEINYLFLHKMFEYLKNTEDECFCEADEKYYSTQPNMILYGRKSPVDKLSAEIDNYPSLNKHPKKIQPQKPGWRLRYFHELFKFEDIQDINDACLNYLEGIEWVTNYYFNQCISRDWYYRYNYSVTILDLFNFMLMNMGDIDDLLKNSIQKNYPQIRYDTDLQLLMCLPPSSKSLLKPELRAIFSDISLGCVHFYPEKFKMTSYLKNFLWEASPILPLVDIEKLQKVKLQLMTSK